MLEMAGLGAKSYSALAKVSQEFQVPLMVRSVSMKVTEQLL